MADDSESKYLRNFANTHLTSCDQTQGKILRVRQFKLRDIPDLMDRLGWVQGARFMRRWFDSCRYELTWDYKLNQSDDRQLHRQHILDDLPFDWLLQSSTRVSPVVDSLIQELSNVYEYSERVGRLKHIFNQLSPGLVMLMRRLERLGLLDPDRKTLKPSNQYFSDLPALELEYTSQFNFTQIGASMWEKAFDELDDVYGALGAFTIKIAATQLSTHDNHHGSPAIIINELGLYIRDTYEFLNDESGDQFLGYWGEAGVLEPGFIDYFKYIFDSDCIDSDGKRYFKVTNDSFNEYRRLTNKGGDFIVYSTVKLVPVSIVVHLNSTDFDEYRARR